MAFPSKMALLTSDSSPESKCFLFRLLMRDREHEKQKLKGTEETLLMEDILKPVLSLPYPSKYKARGKAPCRRQSLCCFTCEYTTSHVQACTQLEPPLCGRTHGASRAALPKLTLLSHCRWAGTQEGSYTHTGTVLTNACRAGFAQTHVACLHSQVHAQGHTCTVAQVLLNVCTQWPYVCMGWAGFPSPSPSFLH